jgi:integrase
MPICEARSEPEGPSKRGQIAAWLNQWDLVVTGEQGVPLSNRMVRYEFQDLLKKAEITGRRIRLHDLRHGAATYMLAQGVPMKMVQEVLGHSPMSITSDTYSLVLPKLQREAADRLRRRALRRLGRLVAS